MGDWRVPAPNPKIGFTENSSHGVTGTPHGDRGGANENEHSGMTFEVIVVPNDVRSGPKVKEFPSQNN